MVLFYLSAIMLMRVLQSVYNKKACLALPAGLKPYVAYLTLSMVLAAGFGAIAFVIEGNFGGISLPMVLIATFSGLCLVGSYYCGIKALQGGTVVLSSIFGTAGLLVPCVLGIFFFQEPMTWLQVICIAVLILAAVLMIDGTKKVFADFSLNTLWYLMGNLVFNGLTMFCQKLFGTWYPKGNVSMFSMLTFLIPSVLLLLWMPFLGKKEGESPKLPKKIWLYAAILAFAVFIIQQFVTYLTPMLSSAVLFTIVNGGATIIAALVGMTVYKEKLTWKSALGILLGLGALICIKVFA